MGDAFGLPPMQVLDRLVEEPQVAVFQTEDQTVSAPAEDQTHDRVDRFFVQQREFVRQVIPLLPEEFGRADSRPGRTPSLQCGLGPVFVLATDVAVVDVQKCDLRRFVRVPPGRVAGRQLRESPVLDVFQGEVIPGAMDQMRFVPAR